MAIPTRTPHAVWPSVPWLRPGSLGLCLLLGGGLVSGATAEPWPAEGKASSDQTLVPLDVRMRYEMSDAFWNPVTQVLWVTSAGGSKKGSWALQYQAGTDTFSVLEFWPLRVDCDEGITQAGLDPVAENVHRVFVLIEGAGTIRENLRTVVPGTGDGTSTTPHSWKITELGTDRSEGITFVPDAWLRRQGFVRGDGSAFNGSTGGWGGLFFVARQDGVIHVLDLDATHSNTYTHVGRYSVLVANANASESKSALAFDRSIGRLYVHLDTTQLAITDLTSTPSTGKRLFRMRALFKEPPNTGPSEQKSNGPEGFAVAPFLADNGQRNSKHFAWICHDFEAGSSNESVQWYKAFRPETLNGWAATVIAGNAQTGPVGTALPVVCKLRAEDGRGYPLVGSTITFSPSSGTVSPTSAVVDAYGEAATTWTMGTVAGTHHLTATGNGLTAVTWSATAVAGPATALAKHQGDLQSAAAGAAVAVPPSVRVVDAFGNPVAGASVSFAVAQGSVLPATAVSNAAGIASTTSWVLGAAPASQSLTARLANGTEVVFQATLTGGAGADTTAPAGVTLRASASGETTVDLAWNAPGDDGMVGTAAGYDVRISATPITEGNFLAAIAVAGEPVPGVAGSAQTMQVAGLSRETVYHVALRTVDEAGNWSPVSADVQVTTPDQTPPAAITDLRVTANAAGSITLSWTAPGEDGLVGQAASYQIRYVLGGAALDEAAFAGAVVVSGAPSPQAAGATQQITITGLPLATLCRVAMKAMDAGGNASGLSNVVEVITAGQQGAAGETSLGGTGGGCGGGGILGLLTLAWALLRWRR